ncbi:unnamed protein product [Camellia sinensis]
MKVCMRLGKLKIVEGLFSGCQQFWAWSKISDPGFSMTYYSHWCTWFAVCIIPGRVPMCKEVKMAGFMLYLYIRPRLLKL